MWQTNKKKSTLFLKALLFSVVMCLFILACRHVAEAAAGTFTTTLYSAPSGTAVTMGDLSGADMLGYTIKNTSGAGTSLTTVQFVLNGGGTGYSWSNTTAAPVGWTVSFPNAQTARFTANGAGYYIASGSSQNFLLVLGAITSNTRDTTDNLNNVQAWNTTGGNKKNNNPAGCSWTRRSLSINSFSVIPTNVSPGGGVNGTFTVVIVLANHSTSNGVTIVSNPQPPTQTWITGGVPLTVSANPSVTLNAGQSGTLTWTITTDGTGYKDCTKASPSTGSVYFTASLTNTAGAGGANRATSKSATTFNTPVTIGCFTGSLSIPTCISSGQTVTVSMQLSNGYSGDLTNINAFVQPGGTAATTYKTGPSQAQGWILSKGTTSTDIWTYQVIGGGSKLFFSSLNTTGVLSGATITAVVLPSSIVTLASTPTITVNTNQYSDKYLNVNVGLTFLNSLCNNINQVAITFPATWTYQDSSALITNGSTDYDDWGTGLAGTTVTFTAGTSMNPSSDPINPGSGDFEIFFSNIPAQQATPNFTVTVTDTTGAALSSFPTVTVGPAGANITPAKLWKEEVR